MNEAANEKRVPGEMVPSKEKHFYTYILRCADGTLYTGWTTDPEKRLKAHNAGKGAKYTCARRPVELFYLEEAVSKEDAMRREWQIKQLTHEEKLNLRGQERQQPAVLF